MKISGNIASGNAESANLI